MFFVYILKSTIVERFYVGSTEDAEKRLAFHNSSQARWTKRYQPWRLVYQETHETRADAVRREKEIKCAKNVKRFLESVGVNCSFKSV